MARDSTEFAQQSGERAMQAATFGMTWAREFAEEGFTQSKQAFDSLLRLSRKMAEDFEDQACAMREQATTLTEQTLANTMEFGQNSRARRNRRRSRSARASSSPGRRRCLQTKPKCSARRCRRPRTISRKPHRAPWRTPAGAPRTRRAWLPAFPRAPSRRRSGGRRLNFARPIHSPLIPAKAGIEGHNVNVCTVSSCSGSPLLRGRAEGVPANAPKQSPSSAVRGSGDPGIHAWMALGVARVPVSAMLLIESARCTWNPDRPFRFVSFDMASIGLTMRWGTGTRLFGRRADVYRRGGVRFPVVWRGACCWLHPDGAVARRRPARVQDAVARREAARDGAVSGSSRWSNHISAVTGLCRTRNFSQGRLYQI